MKPSDVRQLSRIAGRAAGASLYRLKLARTALYDTIAAESPTGEMAGMRDNVLKSFRQIEDISRTVSREVADASPVAGLRNATAFVPKRAALHPSLGTTASSPAVSSEGSSDSSATGAEPARRESLAGGGASSGASIISRVVEETAFARQYSQVLGGSPVNDQKDSSNTITG